MNRDLSIRPNGRQLILHEPNMDVIDTLSNLGETQVRPTNIETHLPELVQFMSEGRYARLEVARRVTIRMKGVS